MTDGAPTAPAIEAVGLTKRFGHVDALRGVNLSVVPGESLALFGPNGAGKTTLLRILTLALRSDGGTFRIDGLDPRQDDLGIRQRVGTISHHTLLYDRLTVRENLDLFCELYGVEDARDRVEELLRTVDLVHRAEDPIRTLSHGMQQRASLARALVHDPPIVFLDEPFSGLDPHAAGTLRATLEQLRTAGRTIVMVTHNLRQGLDLSDRWVILRRGQIVDSGRSDDADPAAFEPHYFDRLSAASAGVRA